MYKRIDKLLTEQDSLAQANQVAEERIANIRTVRAFGQEEREFQRYNEQIDHIMELVRKEALAKGTFFAMVRKLLPQISMKIVEYYLIFSKFFLLELFQQSYYYQ